MKEKRWLEDFCILNLSQIKVEYRLQVLIIIKIYITIQKQKKTFTVSFKHLSWWWAESATSQRLTGWGKNHKKGKKQTMRKRKLHPHRGWGDILKRGGGGRWYYQLKNGWEWYVSPNGTRISDKWSGQTVYTLCSLCNPATFSTKRKQLQLY